MRLWKYAIIGIVVRLIMILLRGVNEIVTWVIFGVFIVGKIFLLQRDIRNWIAERKELKETENDNGK